MIEYFIQNPIMMAAIIWSLPWKAVALWKSARRNEKWWFVSFLFLNTVAILEIFYIYIYCRKNKGEISIQEKLENSSK